MFLFKSVFSLKCIKFHYIISFFLILMSFTSFSQRSHLLFNIQPTSVIDQSTILSNYKFQLNSRISFSYRTAFWVDSISRKEKAAIEAGIGSFFNSYYYTQSGNAQAKSTTSFNSIPGMFVNIEPSYNFLSGKKYAIHSSVNFVAYVFDNYKNVSNNIESDSTNFEEITIPISNFQIAIEPSIGASYFFKFKNGSFIIRFKCAYIIHNDAVAYITKSNSSEQEKAKLNNYATTLSFGIKL